MVKHQLVAFLMFKVYATLTKAGVTPSDVEGLDNCFLGTGSHLFSGLETQYQQMQYFKRHLNLIVSTRCHICIILLAFTWQEPIPVLLGEHRVWKGSGVKRRCVTKQDKFYYVPVLDVLQTLLNNQIVLSEVFVYCVQL